ncbi:MAG: enoyl-CoA hydratase-related protein [Marivibrio sp.]|uniref:enoyl-CoA hydratase-related protein n=1 Tax=Marivibrio sp. TaxID=2039719 RepID=UPI0032ED94D0
MSDAPVRLERDGEIAVVVIDNPPVNALSQAVRQGLQQALDTAEADPAVKAILLIGAGRTFIAGADIKEFGKPPLEPGLPDVIAGMDRLTKPTIAALHGTALGGGLETAMGCHYRLALKGAQVGLPEVKLGILPGAGGTQRLPRLTGSDKALSMMTTGAFAPADEALACGIVDAVSEESDPRAAGLAFAREIVADGRTIRRVRDLPAPEVDPGAVAAWRVKLEREARGLFSPFRILECVEAAGALSFDEGMARERELFRQCMESPQRAGLIHAFFAERACQKIADLPAEASARAVDDLLLVGQAAASDAVHARLEKAKIAVDRAPDPASAGAALADAPVILEADPDGAAAIAAGAREGAVLVSLSAGGDLDAHAGAAGRSEAWVGLIPPQAGSTGRLFEIVRARATGGDALATAQALVKRLRGVGIPVRAGGGSIAGRLADAYRRTGEALKAEGLSEEAVDAACVAFGMAAGPFGGTEPADGEPETAIADRLLHDLARAGEALLADGTIQRALDADMGAILAVGFPSFRGGPLFAVGVKDQ